MYVRCDTNDRPLYFTTSLLTHPDLRERSSSHGMIYVIRTRGDKTNSVADAVSSVCTRFLSICAYENKERYTRKPLPVFMCLQHPRLRFLRPSPRCRLLHHFFVLIFTPRGADELIVWIISTSLVGCRVEMMYWSPTSLDLLSGPRRCID
jgi:hypothetical protein